MCKPKRVGICEKGRESEKGSRGKTRPTSLVGKSHGLNLVLEAKLLSVALFFFFFRGRWFGEGKGPIDKREVVGMT